jgi:hypothetical protein
VTLFKPTPPPEIRGGVYEYIHPHEWTEVGAKWNPNGTWSGLYACAHCPDIGVGGLVGPIPDGYCPCGWVQRNPKASKCEDCGRPMECAA